MTEENPMRTDARKEILAAIDSHDDGGDTAAPIDKVVYDVFQRDVSGPAEVFDAFSVMFRNGRVYEPEPGHVRRTEGATADRDPTGSDGEDDPSPPSLTGGQGP